MREGTKNILLETKNDSMYDCNMKYLTIKINSDDDLPLEKKYKTMECGKNINEFKYYL